MPDVLLICICYRHIDYWHHGLDGGQVSFGGIFKSIELQS